MSKKLINWEVALPLLEQVSLIRVYLTVVSMSTEDYQWYSNKESRSRIEWRWQMSPSTVKLALSQLVKHKMLSTHTRGVYTVEKQFLIEEA